MKDYTRLYSDILFYTKELERAEKELKAAKNSASSDNAVLRAEREYKKIKEKLDGLVEEVPEEIPSKK
jgi:cell division septum initiation protein DivIVA